MLTFLQILFIAAAFIRCPCPIVPHITDANLEVAQDWLSYVRLDWSTPVFSEFSNQLCPGFGSHKGVFLWLLSKQQQIPTARTLVTGHAPGLCPCVQGTDVPPELVSQSSGLCLLPPVGLGSNRDTHPHRGAGQTRNPCSRCSASTSACQGLSGGDPEWETAHSRSSLGPTLASSTNSMCTGVLFLFTSGETEAQRACVTCSRPKAVYCKTTNTRSFAQTFSVSTINIIPNNCFIFSFIKCFDLSFTSLFTSGHVS